MRAPLAGRLRRMSNAAMEQRTLMVLADLSVTTLSDVRRPVSGLSGGVVASLVSVCGPVMPPVVLTSSSAILRASPVSGRAMR